MSDLFADTPEPKPAAPRHDPRVHICTDCRRPNAACGIGDRWWCVACAPVSYWPHKRGGAA